MGTQRRINVYLLALFIAIVLAIVAVSVALRPSSGSADDGYLPKDVPYTPPASPLASAPPEVRLESKAVTLDLPAGSSVGPATEVTGTATSVDGTVYYRISDYRSGQIALGQTSLKAGSPPTFGFRPDFTRPYTKSDPAALDVYVLDANGAEQTTRLTIRLQ